MKVYLAGKIAGDPHYKEKFAKWAKKLEVPAGATVVSPAVLPEGMEKADYMRLFCRTGRKAPAHGLKCTGVSMWGKT